MKPLPSPKLKQQEESSSVVPVDGNHQQPCAQECPASEQEFTSTVVSQANDCYRELQGEKHETTSHRTFQSTLTQLTAWPVDIFASDRHDILQKTKTPVKPDCNGVNSIFSHFLPPQEHSTNGPSVSNMVECREHCWSVALNLSFASSASWQPVSKNMAPPYQHPEDQYTGLTATLNSSPSNSDTSRHQREHYPAATLSAALNSSFASSHYNASLFSQSQMIFRFSDETFHQESGLLKYMNMLVPLGSCEVATCSKSGSFKYTALHVQDPSLDDNPFAMDFKLPTPKLKDLNDNSIPEHVRKGIRYDKKDLVKFQPRVSKMHASYYT